MGRDLNWVRDKTSAFDRRDVAILKEIEAEHDVPAELIMKLIELEFSFEGLGKRRGFLNKIESLLQQDWEKFEAIKQRKTEKGSVSLYDDRLQALNKELEGLKA